MSKIFFEGSELSYDVSGKVILKEISFEIKKGEICALLGPNGSGKTTLLKGLAGLLRLSGGIRLEDKDISTLSTPERARRIVYLSSDLNVNFPITAFEAVSMGRICHSSNSSENLPIIQNSMELCRCWDKRNQILSELSGGEKQLVALARALAQEPSVLFLDETLSKMDLHHQAGVSQMLKEQASLRGMAILMVSHDINLASEIAETGLVLRSGKKLVQGPLSQVLTPEVFSQLYSGIQFVSLPHPTTGAPKLFLEFEGNPPTNF